MIQEIVTLKYVLFTLYKMEPQEVEEMLASIVFKLYWCFADNSHFVEHNPIAQRTESYAPLCAPSNAGKRKEVRQDPCDKTWV